MPSDDVPDWWRKPRRVSVVVDNPNWMTPFARQLVAELAAGGDHARFLEDPGSVPAGGITFYLNCHSRIPDAILARSRHNLVVHASRLPHGRGMSPWVWQILEGARTLPLSLFEAVSEIDAGPVYRVVEIPLEGHELVDELRDRLGRATVELCRWFVEQERPPEGRVQRGTPTYYRRRRPEDSRLDPHMSLAEQFDLLRVVDNLRYPAFFDYRGKRYIVRIEKGPDPAEGEGGQG